jgi:nucleoside-diphosphate-sugar epimerase
MRLFVIGGSGHVGSLIMPFLAEQHTITVFDRKPPKPGPWEYIEGSVTDLPHLSTAIQGSDVLIYMAMGAHDWNSATAIDTSFDVNVKGVYMSLVAAHEAGITHAVYASSMSVYDGNLLARIFPDEEIPPDSSHLYGFTKRMGEECCRVAARRFGMTVNALRLCLPIPDEQWLEHNRQGTPTIQTGASDVAAAFLGAIAFRGGGFEAFMISGDYEYTSMNMLKAKRYLGWESQLRPNG